MNDLIINFTPTGMIPTKEMTMYVPISPSEIIEQVHEAWELGITLVHLHTRTKSKSPYERIKTYKKIIDGINLYCPNLVVCTSLSGRVFTDFEKRSEILELKPDMASLSLGSLNSLKVAIMNSPDMIYKLIEKMNKYGVKPELEAFDSGMINYAKYLIKKNLIQPPYYFNLIFGMIANVQADPTYIGLLIKDLPENSLWSLGGVGQFQLSVNTMAIALNGGVRIGLEDNIWFDQNRKTLATNIDLLKRIHNLAQIFERKIKNPSEFGSLGFYNKEK